jgi:hypothetical protein
LLVVAAADHVTLVVEAVALTADQAAEPAEC